MQFLKTRNHLVQLLKRSLVQGNELDVLAVSETWLNSSVKNAKVEIEFPDWIDRRKLVAVYMYINTHVRL